MKKKILGNIAIVSAIFIATFSIMLIVNYFQVRGATPLQTEVIETLKEINDQNANNTVLQEQIRQLDLMARKAYFTRMEHLMTGVYILLGMLVVFIICTRLYFAKDKDIPDKEIDPIDEWAIKTKARKYVMYVATGVAAIALTFVLLSTPFMRHAGQPESELFAEVRDNETLSDNGKDRTDATGEEENEAFTSREGDGDPNEPVAVEVKTAAENATDGTTSMENTPAGTPSAETPPSGTANDGTTNDGTANDGTTPTGTPPTGTASPGSASQPVISTITHNAFRGNNNNGISAAKGLPVKWDLESMSNVLWKKEVPRQGYNSPVIHGNRVFCSGADEQARELYCFDLTTGALLWTLTAANIPGSPSKMPETTDDTKLAASTVATNGDKVCAIFATGDMICADMQGKLVWAKNLGVPDINYGYSSSLLIYGSSIIVQYDFRKSSKVLALDLATGAERWSKSRNDKFGTWSTPMLATINNTPQLVLMGNPGITAYNPNNGDVLWRVECMSGEIAASACNANGIVFAASDHAKAVAINGADGSLLWESNDVLPEIASPVATKDNLFIATSYGIVASLDTQTGAQKKEHELDADFYSSPMIADGKLYVICSKGKVYIFSADDEFRLINSFDTGEKTYATPAFTDGKIVVRTEKSLYCVKSGS